MTDDRSPADNPSLDLADAVLHSFARRLPPPRRVRHKPSFITECTLGKLPTGFDSKRYMRHFQAALRDIAPYGLPLRCIYTKNDRKQDDNTLRILFKYAVTQSDVVDLAKDLLQEECYRLQRDHKTLNVKFETGMLRLYEKLSGFRSPRASEP